MTWTAAAYRGGWAVDATGVVGSISLGASTAVPSTAVFIGGIAHHQDGRVYTTSWPASNEVYYRGKIACRSDGAMIVSSTGTISQYEGGVGLTYRGEVVGSSQAAQGVVNGMGVRSDGSLCLSDMFNPANFFAASETGFWVKASDISTMFQLSNGTTAVAANGDPVGYWADQSGNAFHLIQATAGNRPTYSSSIPGLTFDGSNDTLANATALSATTGSVAIAFKTGATDFAAAAQVLLSCSDTASNNNYFEIGIDTAGRVYLTSNAGGTSHTVVGVTRLDNSTGYSLVVVHDGNDYYMQLDGVEENPLAVISTGTYAWFGDVAGADNTVLGGTIQLAGLVRPFVGTICEVVATSKVLTA